MEGLGEATFEGALEGLRRRVQALTAGHLSLEEALRAFEEGVAYYDECARRLQGARLRVAKLVETLKGVEEVPLERGRSRGPPSGSEGQVSRPGGGEGETPKQSNP